jgi:hypothetical protein
VLLAATAHAQTSGSVILPATVGSSSPSGPKYVTTPTSFPAGKATITISNFVNMWPANKDFQPFSQDAVYCFDGCARFNNSPSSNTPRLSPLISFQLPGAGWTEWGHLGPGSWLAYADGHTYTLPVTLSASGPISFAFQDTQPSDNTGEFAIRIDSEEPKAAPPAASSPAENGAILETTRDVKVQKVAGGWSNATAGSRLGVGDKVHTGYRSGVVILLPNGHRAVLGPMTIIEITEEGRGYNMRAGEVEAVIGHQGRGLSNFEVKTATVTASVRGTRFTVLHDPASGDDVVTVRAGVVVVRRNGAKRTVTLRRGQEVLVTRRRIGKVTKPGRAGTPRGGLARGAVHRRTAALVAGAAAGCGIDTASEVGVLAVSTARGGWRVVATVAGRVAGRATWRVRGARFSPANTLARQIAAHCG